MSFLLTICVPLLQIAYPVKILLMGTAVFAVVVGGLLLFIAYYTNQRSKRARKKLQWNTGFYDLISEAILCESKAEVEALLHQPQYVAVKLHLQQKAYARKILIKELVKTKDNLSGGAAENLRWLYENLQLDQESYRRFCSAKWHKKASAIQQLAHMQQTKYLTKIYRETNNSNPLVRTEAQIAVVKLTGFKGLRFLNIISYPVTQWQQLCLISHIQEQDVDPVKIEAWLQSSNESVMEFALRLIEIYKYAALHSHVLSCLQHSSPGIRRQALQTIKEISSDEAIRFLITHFSSFSKEEQLTILDIITASGETGDEVRFLSSLIQHNDEAIRYRVAKGIQQLSPAWSAHVFTHMKNEPSYVHILSLLNKEAV